MKNNKGFAVLESLLILVIIGMIGGTGWYVYQAHNKANNSLSSADSVSSSASNSSSKAGASDSTSGWKEYADGAGLFSVKYPSSWATAAHPELCGNGIFLVGADSKSVGACGTDGGGQMSISAVEGDQRSESGLAGKYYKDVSTKSVTVDSVVGERQGGTVAVAEGEPWLGPKNGTKVVLYTFYKNNHTYVASYTQADGYKDVLSDFDLMVTKTLKLSVSLM